MNIRTALKVTLLLVGTMVTVWSSSSVFAQKWASMSPEGSFCKFKLPGEVEKKINEGADVLTYKFSASHAGTNFLFSYSVHANQLSEYESLAQASLESFVESLNGELESQDPWKIKKHLGTKASISVPSHGAMCQYQVVLAGQIQYQAVVIATADEWDQKLADKFFKSIKLKQ